MEWVSTEQEPNEITRTHASDRRFLTHIYLQMHLGRYSVALPPVPLRLPLYARHFFSTTAAAAAPPYPIAG